MKYLTPAICLLALLGCSEKPEPAAPASSNNYALEPIHQESLEELAKRKAEEARVQQANADAVLAAEIELHGWRSSVNSDEFSGQNYKYSSISSSTKAYFASPYDGGSSASVTFRKAAGSPQEAYFSIDKGQIVCSYRDCTVQVKVDGQKAQTFSMSRTTDYSTTVIFFDNPSRLRKLLSSAKPFQVRATFYKSGEETFQFLPPNKLPAP